MRAPAAVRSAQGVLAAPNRLCRLPSAFCIQALHRPAVLYKAVPQRCTLQQSLGLAAVVSKIRLLESLSLAWQQWL